ncbi:MAG: hypothetical protein HZA53_01335 [Planctomycetes bacterium]|nr:hypothetical protein [Planctomycetota bacterium]
MNRLEDLAEKELSPPEVTACLDAVTPATFGVELLIATVEVSLLRLTWDRCRNEHIPRFESLFELLGPDARTAALAAIGKIRTRRAMTAYLSLLRRHGWPKSSYPAMTELLDEGFEFADEILPCLLDGSIARLPDAIAHQALLAFGDAGKLPRAIATRARAVVLPRVRAELTRARRHQRSSGVDWRWSSRYEPLRNSFGILLDLLGHLGKDDASIRLLRQAEALHDPRLRMFAILSLLRLKARPDAKAVLAVARDSETRIWLFRQLAEQGRRTVFPKSEAQQAKLAESDMVNWLAFPTELGRAPHHIELMNTVEIDAGRAAGVFVYYVFRFRVRGSHFAADDGWMGGVSGPFRKRDFPTADSLGDTFSSFTKWEEFNLDEQLTTVEDLRDRWREARRGGGD